MKKNTFVILLTVFLLSVLSAQDNAGAYTGTILSGEYPFLTSGETVNAIITTKEGEPYITCRVSVPEGAARISFVIENSPVDLDLYLKKGSEITDYKDVDYSAVLEDFNEMLYVDRLSSPPLEAGVYYLDVAYRREDEPAVEGYPRGVIPFSLTYTCNLQEVKSVLVPGMALRGRLENGQGMNVLYSVTVPPQTAALRFDIFGTASDLDMLVTCDDPGVSPKNYDYKAVSLSSREYLVVPAGGDGYVPSGTYYILVYDRVSSDAYTEFSIMCSFSQQPPRELLGIPVIPHQASPLERVMSSTVGITGSSTRGSGVLVSADGYILTNWHVVRGDNGLPLPLVTVSVTRDFHDPPDELFSALVMKYDERLDLALLKVISGYYGQKIPDGYEFPFFGLASDSAVRIGQPVTIIGFPDVGGSGSRVSLTLTRGIISGFMRFYDGVLYKTDAEINPGNSGGAAVNAFYELIGLPTTIVGDSSGKIGYIHPVSFLPSSWLMLINGH